jgi:transaldolase
MKFFLDTADVDEIRKAAELGILDGITTNPSLVAKSGRPFAEVIQEITEIVDGPISAEVVATDKENILKEGRHLAKIHPNIVVKVPLIPEGIAAVKVLSGEGIRVNVTLCFSAVQALIAAKAGAAYISPFLGRLDDIGHVGMDLIDDIREIYDNYDFQTEILAASLRHPLHVLEAARAGADVATLPAKLFHQLFKHPLTDKGLADFLADWEKAEGQIVKG